MLKELLIKGGLMVGALILAESVIENLEKKALKQQRDEERDIESENKRYEDAESILREAEGY